MRFLHTADWHVGKTIRGRRRDEEFDAVLAEILEVAKREQVDALLLAGDVFDSTAPPPDAERLVYEFFRELYAARIPAVVIGGNHDHPRRLEAVSRILEIVDITVRGEPVTPDRGGVVELPSRDGTETARIAMLPWVPERQVVEFETLLAADGKPFHQYADRVARMLTFLCEGLPPHTVNILLAHVFIDGSLVGGGERPLHLGETFAVKAQALPTAAQYIALGHVHRPQKINAAVPTYYPGSPLQLDFGERDQQKSVLLVDVHPARPPQVQPVPLSSGRKLLDVHTTLADLERAAPQDGDAYLRVFVHVDGPVPHLAEQVRELLPNTVDIQRVGPEAPSNGKGRPVLGLGPHELLPAYYRHLRGRDMPEPVAALFRHLYEEESRETDPA